MISKKISILAVGFNYHEINYIQDDFSEEFSHFNFDFAISIRDSWYRLDISDYDFVIFDLTSSDVDNIIALQEMSQNINNISIIVIVKADELLKISNTVNMNPYFFINKDSSYTKKVINFIKTDIENSKNLSKNGLELNHKTNPFFETLINTVHDRVMIVGLDYSIKSVNNEMLRASRYNMQDVVGQKCYEFSYKFDQPCWEKGYACPLKEILKNGNAHTCTHQHSSPKSNSIDEFHVSAIPLKNEFNSTVDVLLAIKKEKISQKSLVVDKNLLEMLVNGISDGLFFCDSENNIVLVNQAVTKLLGMERSQILHQSIDRISLGDGNTWLSEIMEKARNGFQLTKNLKIQFKNKWFMLRYIPLYGEKNQYIGAFLYLTEMSSISILEVKQKQIDQDIFTLTKYFPTKMLAEG